MNPNGAPQGGSLFQQMYSAQQQQLPGYAYPPLPPSQQQQQPPPPQQPQPYAQPAPPPPTSFGGPNTNTYGYSTPGSPPLPQQQPPHPYPPPPPPPSFPAYTPPVMDDDYYKGFHDAVVRPSGPIWGNAVSWVIPLMVNAAFFVGPIWYFRRKYMQAMGSAAAAGATAGSKKGKGGTSGPMSGLMDMMNPMKAKNFRTEVKGTTFKDVIGIPEAKEDLKQYVDFLKEPAKFTRLGARLPKGCLLTGQPGTGKTLLARAVAGEASTPFFSCSGADFIEIFGGSGPKRVRELFEEAKAAAPCVVFIDEIDAIGSRNQGGRSMGGGGSSEENRTINQLLAELDGLTSKEAIVVIAATNYAEAIDKALLREGRFDRKVNIPMPDQKARCELFEFYLNRIITGDPICKPKVQKFKTRKEGEAAGSKDSSNGSTPSTPSTNGNNGGSSVDGSAAVEAKVLVTEDAAPGSIKVVPGVSNKEYAQVLADRTPGVSPAQISTIVNEGALNAATNGQDVVTLNVLQESIDDVLIGKKHRQRMSDFSLHRTAYHEVGHCIMAWTNPLQKDVIKLSIIPRGRAGGYTQQVQDEAMEPHTDEFLFSQLCVLMGGRAAECIFEKDISIGAMDDLQRATRLAMEKLLKYGMSKSIGQLAFKPNDKNDGRAWMTWSENLHAKVEAEARELVEAAFLHTHKTLRAHQERHTKLAELLLEKKELNKAEIASVLGERPVSPARIDNKA